MRRFLLICVSLLIISVSLVNGQNEIQPSGEGGIYTLKSGNTEIVIDAGTGSRIISYKLNDVEILGTKVHHRTFYGSTLWLSPEGKWKGQGLLDNGPYEVNKNKKSVLRFTSSDDTVRGFSFAKEFRAIRKDTSLFIRYIIRNISGVPQEVSPWEVTRVPTGGLAFVPRGSSGNIPTPNKMYPLLNIQDINGTIWYPYDTAKLSAQKLFMDGGEGWMAYVYNEVVFIKKVPVLRPGEAAPNEKNIELYVNRDKTYIELENQGSYQKLNSGEWLTYEVKWYARKLPAGIKAEAGNQALLDFVRRIVLRNNGRSERR